MCIRDRQQAKVCPYLLRNAVIDRPNQAWSIDITYIPIKHGFLYLTAVIDWYSRCIVGWEVDDTLDTRMVITALKKAFMVAKPIILNSDQGCQFTSNEMCIRDRPLPVQNGSMITVCQTQRSPLEITSRRRLTNRQP